jgi:hypothetical protein
LNPAADETAIHYNSPLSILPGVFCNFQLFMSNSIGSFDQWLGMAVHFIESTMAEIQNPFATTLRIFAVAETDLGDDFR